MISQCSVIVEKINVFNSIQFTEATEDGVKIIFSTPSEHYDLDPMPTWLVKEC